MLAFHSQKKKKKKKKKEKKKKKFLLVLKNVRNIVSCDFGIVYTFKLN